MRQPYIHDHNIINSKTKGHKYFIHNDVLFCIITDLGNSGGNELTYYVVYLIMTGISVYPEANFGIYASISSCTAAYTYMFISAPVNGACQAGVLKTHPV